MGIPAPWVKGGPATHLPALVEYFQTREDFEIKTFYFGSQKKQEVENVFLKLINTSKALLQFIHLIIIFKPNIIHLNSAFDKTSILRDVAFSLVSKLARKPLFFKIHGSHNELLYTKNPVLLFFIRLYFWGSMKVGVLSEIEKNEFILQFGNLSKLLVVKNIVHFTGSEIQINNLAEEGKKYDALFVSRIEKGKGLEDILQALPIIIKKNPAFILAVAGSGSSLQEYKKIADDLNIQTHIKWLGHVQNQHLFQIFSQSKIFIFPSHYPEGMPMSMVEALIHGMPIITTKTRFAKSYLKEKENVLFIDRHQPEQIADRIFFLENNSSLCGQMKSNNYFFIRNFNQEKVGLEFSKIYYEMLSSHN